MHSTAGFWHDAWRSFCSNRLALVALIAIGALAVVSIFGPMVSGYTYFETHLEDNNMAPCAKYWFGSDDLGRDMFTRTWYGARISLFVGFTAAIIDLVIGVLWGGIAAFFGGRLDNWMMRLADVLYAIPYLLIVIMLMVVLGPGIGTIVIAMTITGWIGMARVVRGQLLKLKEQEFIAAARVLGAGRFRLLFRHLLPNAVGTMVVMMALTIPTAIFTETFLSFLGLGVQAPIASWGTMASEALGAMRYYPWRLFFPAGFICFTMLSLHIVSDALREALDPRQR
jgi:oligopeptide transport system permease protein